MIKVHVPATSANLGPGYDCLGLALSWEGIFSFEALDHGVRITGCDSAYQNEKNLVYQAFQNTLTYMKEEVPGIAIHIDCDLPLQRGLGSSAACIVAGALGANAFFHNKLNKYEIFKICTDMEGHPDNVAPALFGQLTVSFMDDKQPNMIRYGVHPDLKFLAIIPEGSVSTKEAREILPTTLSYETAIKQLGRCSAFCKAIEIGNGVIMQKACQDLLHEPYRKKLILEYDEIYKIQQHHQAHAMFISGSGSTMMIVDSNDGKIKEMAMEIQMKYPKVMVKELTVNRKGAYSEVI